MPETPSPCSSRRSRPPGQLGLYAVFASQLSADTEASAGTKPPPWKLGVEFLRSLTLATVVAGLGARCSIAAWSGRLLLGFALWVGFPSCSGAVP